MLITILACITAVLVVIQWYKIPPDFRDVYYLSLVVMLAIVFDIVLTILANLLELV